MNLRVRTKYGVRAFSHVGPELWNLLPTYIRDEHDIDELKKLWSLFWWLEVKDLYGG